MEYTAVSRRTRPAVRRSLLLGLALLAALAPALSACAQERGRGRSRDAANAWTVAELREVQQQLIDLTPSLKEATVNVRIGRAQGSGVIVNAEGLVLTAAHVSGAPGQPAVIMTHDGQRHRGVTLGRNSVLDASMIQIESSRKNWPHRPPAENLPALRDWCIVLGHPGGYERDRPPVLRFGQVLHQNRWLIQSDCELIGGDSGGPLFNLRGEVIGINTRIGESTDVNLHVPIDAYRRDWDRLLAGEDFRSQSGAYVGIATRKQETGPGLQVTRVVPESPAAQAGIREGDVLLAFDGKDLADVLQFRELLGQEFPGKMVKLTLLRNGASEDVNVRLSMRWD